MLNQITEGRNNVCKRHNTQFSCRDFEIILTPSSDFCPSWIVQSQMKSYSFFFLKLSFNLTNKEYRTIKLLNSYFSPTIASLLANILFFGKNACQETNLKISIRCYVVLIIVFVKLTLLTLKVNRTFMFNGKDIRLYD